MRTVEDALDRILQTVVRQPYEPVSLHGCRGRFLAEDIISTMDVPPWDNSAMDGYAVRAEDTTGASALSINEMIGAGSVGQATVSAATASGIMTGAPVPEGADAVVMVEHTEREGQTVRILRPAVRGQHIRRRGEDIARGAVVLKAGTRLDAAQIGLAASVGNASLPVYRQPKVAVLSTGDEVVMPGQPLGPGQIYSSNTYTLCALTAECGAVPVDLGNAPDDLDGTVTALREALQYDVVVTTGGVSVGEYDYVKEAYARLGATMDFWKVKMKPGKPLAFGLITLDGRSVPLFGLPGNPVSCMVNFYQFVRPWILSAMGSRAPFLPLVDAIAGEDFVVRPGRAKLVRVVLSREDGHLVCRRTGNQSSGVLTSMSLADGMLLIGLESEGPRTGDPVRVQLIRRHWGARQVPPYEW